MDYKIAPDDQEVIRNLYRVNRHTVYMIQQKTF